MILALTALLAALARTPFVLRRGRRRGAERRAGPEAEADTEADTGVDTGADSGAVDDERPTAEPAEQETDGAPGDVDGERDGERDGGREGEPSAPMARRLGRTRALLHAPLAAVRAHRRVDEAAFEALEEALLIADVGIATTTRLLDAVRERLRARELGTTPEDLLSGLRAEIAATFAGDDTSLHRSAEGPSVWLFAGVNGVGKTTTIGKLAQREIARGATVVLAAGDTFRAAAAEQLEHWAQACGAGFVRGGEGADPSAVIFDAVQHAAARGADLVLADSAGRLHTRVNLMDELRKVRRVADRPPGRVTEVLLVLDATTGQNGLAQAREFTEAVEVTGIVLTKLDGTAKGGIVLAIRAETGLPIKLVGLGEQIEDLVEFDPAEFAAALIG